MIPYRKLGKVWKWITTMDIPPPRPHLLPEIPTFSGLLIRWKNGNPIALSVQSVRRCHGVPSGQPDCLQKSLDLWPFTLDARRLALSWHLRDPHLRRPWLTLATPSMNPPFAADADWNFQSTSDRIAKNAGLECVRSWVGPFGHQEFGSASFSKLMTLLSSKPIQLVEIMNSGNLHSNTMRAHPIHTRCGQHGASANLIWMMYKNPHSDDYVEDLRPALRVYCALGGHACVVCLQDGTPQISLFSTVVSVSQILLQTRWDMSCHGIACISFSFTGFAYMSTGTAFISQPCPLLATQEPSGNILKVCSQSHYHLQSIHNTYLEFGMFFLQASYTCGPLGQNIVQIFSSVMLGKSTSAYSCDGSSLHHHVFVSCTMCLLNTGIPFGIWCCSLALLLYVLLLLPPHTQFSWPPASNHAMGLNFLPFCTRFAARFHSRVMLHMTHPDTKLSATQDLGANLPDVDSVTSAALSEPSGDDSTGLSQAAAALTLAPPGLTLTLQDMDISPPVMSRGSPPPPWLNQQFKQELSLALEEFVLAHGEFIQAGRSVASNPPQLRIDVLFGSWDNLRTGLEALGYKPHDPSMSMDAAGHFLHGGA